MRVQVVDNATLRRYIQMKVNLKNHKQNLTLLLVKIKQNQLNLQYLSNRVRALVKNQIYLKMRINKQTKMKKKNKKISRGILEKIMM